MTNDSSEPLTLENASLRQRIAELESQVVRQQSLLDMANSSDDRRETRIDEDSLLSFFIESINDDVFLLDRTYRYIGFNQFHAKGMKERYGVNIRLGDCPLDFTTDEQIREMVRQNYELTLKGKQFNLIWSIPPPARVQKYSHLSMGPLKNRQGEIIGIAIITTDVTELKQTEEKLRVSEERLRLALASAKQGLYDLNVQTGEAITNPEYAEMLGYDPADFHETNALWLERLHPDDREQVGTIYQNYINGLIPEYRVEFRQYTDEGNWKWILSLGKLVQWDEQGKPLRMLGTHTDITPLKIAGQQIQKLSRIYATLSQCNQTIVRIRDRQALFEEVCRIAVEYGGIRMAWISLTDLQRNLIVPVARHGTDMATQNEVTTQINPESAEKRNIGSLVVRTGQHQVINEKSVDHSPAVWRVLSHKYNLQSIAMFPLKQAGEIVGILSLVSEEAGFFDAELVRLLDEMALDISFALDNFALREQRQHNLKSLQESEERFRATFEQASVGMSHAGFDGSFQRVNLRFCEMLGYSREELLSMTFHQITYPEDLDTDLKLVEKLQAGEIESYSLEKRYVRKDGSLIWANLTVSLAHDINGVPYYFIAVVMDVSQRKRTEEELHLTQEQFRQAQKMEAVGRLAGGVAHDFNNLLTAIIGYSDLLLAELPKEARFREDVGEIRKVADRATDLTRQLLALSRKQVLEPKLLNLNNVIEEMKKMLLRLIGEDLKFSTSLKSKIGQIFADHSQLEQVILNLVVNARDAMPDGGELTIETAQVELDEEYCYLHQEVTPGSYIMLAVSDTGHGMSEEIRSHIFEPFFTTKEKGKGTGLGLSTVYGIIKQSEGHIWVYSEPEVGTTFKIYLPLAKQEQIIPRRKKLAAQEHTIGGTETILLVEDDQSVRELTSRILRVKGYQVLTAFNPEEALRLEKNYDQPIHLLLTDMVMPGMNGWQLSQLIIKVRPGIKVLFTSGYTEMVFERSLSGTEINYLPKPFNSEALYTKIRTVLDNN